jgi:Holliday junction resolvasome RuvABC ATP-dependent DNA helicase subunit
MITLADLFADHRFFGSRDGDVKLARLRRDFQFSDKWQVVRLAIAASLATSGQPPAPADRDGSEIRGVTLFKRDGTGPAVVALIATHAKAALEPEEIARQVEAHWDRGLGLLFDRVEESLAEGSDADSVLISMAREAAVSADGASTSPGVRAGLLDERIVGQAVAKRMVVPLIQDALASDPLCLEGTLLFTGPASTGKTLFARVIADALELPFIDTNGSVVRDVASLLTRIEKACSEVGARKQTTAKRGSIPVNRFPPAVIFIDECHAMSRGIQTELLTAMEPSEREAKTESEIADVSQVTILLATTDSSKLLEPLRTRTREIPLEPYTRAEVAEIVSRAHASWPTTVCLLIAVAGRLIPRQALIAAEDFDRFMRQEHPDERPGEQLVLRFMKGLEMDELGLLPRDYRYLGALPEDGSARGLQAIASQLHLEEAEVEDGIEPFLLQLRLIERQAKGRRVTPAGLELLDGHDD